MRLKEEAERGRYSWCADTFDVFDVSIHIDLGEYIISMHLDVFTPRHAGWWSRSRCRRRSRTRQTFLMCGYIWHSWFVNTYTRRWVHYVYARLDVFTPRHARWWSRLRCSRWSRTRQTFLMCGYVWYSWFVNTYTRRWVHYVYARLDILTPSHARRCSSLRGRRSSRNWWILWMHECINSIYLDMWAHYQYTHLDIFCEIHD